ncbi:hypothetical protein ES703_91506 [subsurface metagenome]
MPNRMEYKEALSEVDRDIRLCLLYLERLIDEKFSLALKVKQPPTPPTPKVDFSPIESKLDSLQKQIDGLRRKVDVAHTHTQKHHENEIFLKNLAKKADQVLGKVKSLYEELYASGFFKKEGTRRKIREAGLMK